VFGAVTATVLTVTHPAHAVMSPAITRTDALLLAVERDAFIAAVTRHADCWDQAGSIIDERLDGRSTGPPHGDGAAARR
jgi:hypothetical protein